MNVKWIIFSIVVGVMLVGLGAFITYMQGNSKFGYWVALVGGLIVGVTALIDIAIHDRKWDREIQHIKSRK